MFSSAISYAKAARRSYFSFGFINAGMQRRPNDLYAVSARATLDSRMGRGISTAVAVGVIVSILIVGAVAAVGYFQFKIAPSMFSSTTTTTSTLTGLPPPGRYVNVTIPTGAATTAPGFAPDTITVVLGVNNTVVWINGDGMGIPHTVTAKDNSWGSGTLNQGDIYMYTFATAGTYNYYCTFHPTVMKGTVVVKSG